MTTSDEQIDETKHDHSVEDCPICSSPESVKALSEMRERNRLEAERRHKALIKEIAEDPSAFVFVVEGYENAQDRSPTIMRITTTAEKAHHYLSTLAMSEGQIYQVTPNRLDSDRTGEVVLFYVIMRDGILWEHDGRYLRG